MLSSRTTSAIVRSDWFETNWATWALVDTDFVIRAVNRTLERELALVGDQVVGRHLFEVFPENPTEPVGAQEQLAASLEHVVRTARRDWRGVQRYDVPVPGSADSWDHRWWIPLHIPVIEDGQVAGVLITSQDVTVPLAAADRDAIEALSPRQLEDAAGLLLRQFPHAPPSLVLSVLAHSQRKVLEATGVADHRSATDLARLRLEARTRQPALVDEALVDQARES